MSRTNNPDYPAWVCYDCGETYGTWFKRGIYIGPPHHCATHHMGTCGLCKAVDVSVTQPRDYGHLRSDWHAGLKKSK
jgi:hypothetical protein